MLALRPYPSSDLGLRLERRALTSIHFTPRPPEKTGRPKTHTHRYHSSGGYASSACLLPSQSYLQKFNSFRNFRVIIDQFLFQLCIVDIGYMSN